MPLLFLVRKSMGRLKDIVVDSARTLDCFELARLHFANALQFVGYVVEKYLSWRHRLAGVVKMQGRK